jgi:hypothetical protein
MTLMLNPSLSIFKAIQNNDTGAQTGPLSIFKAIQANDRDAVAVDLGSLG